MKRREFVKAGVAAGVAAAISSPGAFAQRAEFTYKYANNLPVTHPLHIRAQKRRIASPRSRTDALRSRSSRTTSSAGTRTC